MDQSIINFKVYEDSVEYVGMAQATLPDLTALTQSISGAGIAGNVESVILGHFDAMTLGLNFRTVTDQSVKLSEPRRHTIDLRVAQQDEDVVAGKVVVRAVKHIFVVIPKSDKGGSVAPPRPPTAPASTPSATGRPTLTARRCVRSTSSTSSAMSTAPTTWPTSARRSACKRPDKSPGRNIRSGHLFEI